MSNTWEEAIHKVALGNAFESGDHFYCKNGMTCALEIEAEYQRAQQVVLRFPENYRILRYEGHAWQPRLYQNWRHAHAMNYVSTDNEEDLNCTGCA